jgi:mono/diheme cytochrome c family protein
MLYEISLLLHSYTRWLIFIAMTGALFLAWRGVIRPRPWGLWERRFAAAFAILVSIQFVWGLALYVVPDGIAQAALRDMGASMRVRELRFFGLEHPLQMAVAIGLVHMGWARSRKAPQDKTKFRWAAGAFTVSTVLILIAIPWWRPAARPLTSTASAPAIGAEDIALALDGGSAQAGAALFVQSIGGQPACSTCHALDASRIVGPGMQGIAIRAGERVPGQPPADYLYASIVRPGAHVVEGYANVMPAAFGDVLDDDQTRDLVAYLLTFDQP